MQIYNLHFNIKGSCLEAEVISLAKEFAGAMVKEGVISSFSLEKTTDIGSFDEMLDFHMAIHFASEEHMGNGFSVVREKYMYAYPHNKLMSSVSSFKVSFSEQIAVRK